MTIGSATKASWADPVRRAKRLAALAANKRAKQEGALPGDHPIQRRCTDAVTPDVIPRDPVEVEIFGERA